MLEWPKTLPQILGKDWNKTVSISATISEPRVVGATYRGSKPTVLPVKLTLTTEQASTLEVFVKSITKGALPFLYTDPYTEQKIIVRFLPAEGEILSIQYKAPGYWGVFLSLEII